MREKLCENCHDEDGVKLFPYYGLAPHNHKTIDGSIVIGETSVLAENEWPDSFIEDVDVKGCGTYTHCPVCGD